ncbi:MAG TPA: pseudouridine-5'-phosphate glycosidase [Gemmatimonadaceae bacterium]|nr:pseudouridine-5'-phosphate glycosidase [Gemmatimonadaceae bacterium]
MAEFIRILPQIAAAIRDKQPVVALESSVLAQGLPIPQNREAAERMTTAVKRAGAMPAITAVVSGTPTIGLTDEELERFLRRDGVRKVSARDIPAAVVKHADGATTVAASIALASAASITVFATGGIGGVHRDAPYDESADLAELARTPMIVVCAGAKSILDLPATWERLESMGVPVVGYQTDELPGFFSAETGIPLHCRVDDVSELVALHRAHRALGRNQSLLVVQAPPREHALPRERVESAVARAQADAHRDGIRGAAVTPYLLAAVTRLTEGSSLSANLALLERNAALAGEIATMYSRADA